MLDAIKYNLTHLTDFNGRDTRKTFWFYVLFLTLAQIALSFAISLPMAGSMIGDAVVSAGQGADPAEVQQRIVSHVSGMMQTSMWLSVILSVLMAALLIAAFTRRLHDSNKPGWIAILTAVIQMVALTMAINGMEDVVNAMVLMQSGDLEAAQELQSKVAMRGLIGWVPLLLIVIFGIMRSTPGDNRYGPKPVAV